MPHRTVAFHTLGCKVNQYDTEVMKEAFMRHGYSIAAFSSKADVYVINTCTVTGRSDAKSRQAIRQATRRNPDAVIAVTGCYSQVDPGAVGSIEGVDIVVGTNIGPNIVGLVEQAKEQKHVCVERQTDWHCITRFGGRTRAALKVQEGCEQFCSYCIVPIARGRLRSRDAAEVVEQVRKLVATGFKEVVLTGVHLGAYGKETQDAPRLPALIDMLGKVSGLKRLRLSSIEPIDIEDSLFRALAENEAFCEHLHMPLQSGCDRVLNAMNRPYTTSEFEQIAEKARMLFPDIAITTDIITGFPGETEQEHEQTMRFVERVGFSRLHVFVYSARKGTKAARMPDKVPPVVMKRRRDELIQLGSELMYRYHRGFLGRRLEVLIEDLNKPPEMIGFSRNYIRVLCDGRPEDANEIVNVLIQKAEATGCSGKILL